MKTVEQRLAEAERTISQLLRDSARNAARPALPLAPKHGRFVGKTNSDVDIDGTTDVTIWTYEVTGAAGWTESATVIPDVQPIGLTEGQTIPADTDVYVFWYKTTWVMLVMTAGTSPVRFELTGTLSLSGHAPAKLMQPTAIGTGAWEATDPVVEIEVYDPFGSEGMWAGISGYQGWAFPRGQSYLDEVPDPDETRAAYDIIWMEQIAQTIEFTTTEYMGQSTAGRLTACSVTWFDHQGKDPGSTVEVRDPQGAFPDVPGGAKGEAKYDYHNGYYRITRCQRVAISATADLTADSCGSAMSIDNFAVDETGEYCLAPPTTPTPDNLHDMAGVDNDTITLLRVTNTLPNPEWRVVAVDMHAVTVKVDDRVDGFTFQKKTRTVYVQFCDDTADADLPWTTWHTGDDCEE